MLCGSFLGGRLVPTTLLVELMYLINLWASGMLPGTLEGGSASCYGMEQGCHWADGAMLCCVISDPAFVRAQLIPDSSERNDDKLYFFFREKSADAPLSPGIYSRIGRICLVGVAEDRQGHGQGCGQGDRHG